MAPRAGRACSTYYTSTLTYLRGVGSRVREQQALEGMKVNDAGTPAKVTTLASSALLLCAVMRVSFSSMAPTIATELSLTAVDLSYLYAALLVGYLIGQIPAGLLSDRFGGATVLFCGCALWSIATSLHWYVPYAAHPVMTLAALRFALGLGSSVAIPGVASMLAQMLPPDLRPKAMSTAYGCFNIGTVIGVSLTPVIAAQMTWPATFGLTGAIGTAWALWTLSQVRKVPLSKMTQAIDSPTEAVDSLAGADIDVDVGLGQTEDAALVSGTQARFQAGKFHTLKQFFALAWAHSVIGWGFFILQNWVPTFLGSLGTSSPVVVGFLSALPWAAAAGLAFVFGNLFQRLEKRGMDQYRARSLAHGVACLGSAAAILPLGLYEGMPAGPALLCLGLAVSLQTCNYPGFHSYVQQYGASKAGTILGITNSFGIVTGIVGNLVTGFLVQNTNSYTLMFRITSILYISSFVLWRLMLRGEPVYADS